MYNTNTGNFIWFSRWHAVVNHVSSVPSVCRGLCWDIMEFKGPEWKWFLPQQHPPDEGLTVVPGVSFTFGFSPPPAVAPGPILFLISAAMVMKACSTLVAFLALVSKKGIPRESANSWTQQRWAKVRSSPFTVAVQRFICDGDCGAGHRGSVHPRQGNMNFCKETRRCQLVLVLCKH